LCVCVDYSFKSESAESFGAIQLENILGSRPKKE
jgi:hypothetical protein